MMWGYSIGLPCSSYSSGQSVPSSKPPSTMRDASAMAARIWAISLSKRSSGAQISAASCTGAQTSIPRSVAKQQASRNISAPLACIGKLRSDLFNAAPSLTFTATADPLSRTPAAFATSKWIFSGCLCHRELSLCLEGCGVDDEEWK